VLNPCALSLPGEKGGGASSKSNSLEFNLRFIVAFYVLTWKVLDAQRDVERPANLLIVRIQSTGFRIYVFVIRVRGLGDGFEDLRVLGFGFRIKGVGFAVLGLGFRF